MRAVPTLHFLSTLSLRQTYLHSITCLHFRYDRQAVDSQYLVQESDIRVSGMTFSPSRGEKNKRGWYLGVDTEGKLVFLAIFECKSYLILPEDLYDIYFRYVCSNLMKFPSFFQI